MNGHTEWFFPVSHAADLLGCPRRSVYQLISSGALESIITPQRKIKVSRDSIFRYLGQAAQEPCQSAH